MEEDTVGLVVVVLVLEEAVLLVVVVMAVLADVDAVVTIPELEVGSFDEVTITVVVVNELEGES